MMSVPGRRLGTWSALLALVLGGCSAPQAGDRPAGETPTVVAAFYPLEFVSAAVAGEHAEVIGLTQAGVEPHDLELTSGQIQDVLASDLLVFAGEGFQPAVEDLLGQVQGEKLDVLEGLDLMDGSDEPDERGEDEGREGRELDPHVWLDPIRMADITRSVQQTLATLDPEHALELEANADRLVVELEELDREFQRGLGSCSRREIVTSHAAFGYLADRYELEQHAVSGLDPGSEASPRQLQELAEIVRDKGVTTIFFERLVPKDLAETLARETGTTTAALDPIETRPQDGDYLSAMRTNLAELRRALDCE